jgi:hypothetical protein
MVCIFADPREVNAIGIRAKVAAVATAAIIGGPV